MRTFSAKKCSAFLFLAKKEKQMKLLKSLLALATAMTVSTTVLAEESVLSDVKNNAKTAWQTVKTEAKEVGGQVKKGAIKVKDGAVEVKDKVADKMKSAKEATKETFTEAKDATKEKFTEAKDATKEKFSEGKKAVKRQFKNEQPAQVEDKSTVKEGAKSSATRSKKVDINSADAETLQSLSGIGEVKAKAIIEYREKNGKIKNLEELSKVPGVGDSTLEKIKPHVRFN